MSDKLSLAWVTRCRHCRKAIGVLSDDRVGWLQDVGWLHFATHDGHGAEPMKPFIDHGIAISA